MGLKTVAAALALTTLCGGCTTVERNQLALGLCNRAAWCTETEQPREASGPPQVQAMEGRKPERIVHPKK